MTEVAVPNPIMKAWQQLLVDAGYPMLPYGADGLGGQATHDALIAYQTAHPPLAVTGQFDEATRALLNPPHKPQLSIPPAVLELIVGTALDAIIPPSLAKEMLMNFLPTIVQLIVSWLPGIPDDIKLVEAEIAEIASTDSGVKKLRTALVFAEALIDRIQAILDKVDPAGAIQPPASQVAVTDSSK